MTGAILDLDDTLVNTAGLAHLRQRRDWRGCVRNLSETVLFEGIPDLLAALRGKGFKIGIVTTSVSYYAEAVLNHHQIPYDALVAYHDCSPRKPHPASILKCMSKLGLTPENTIGLGDAATDAEAYAASSIKGLGAGWSPKFQASPAWTAVLKHPSELTLSL